MLRPLFLLLAVAAPALSQPPVASARWSFDEIVLKNGATHQGLILGDRADGTLFRIVRRPAGRPTVTLTTLFTKGETKELKPLGEAERALLRERLDELDGQADGERRRMDALALRPAAWLGKKDAARRYESDQFVLVSSAPDEVTRRAGVRLEQIYTAFARVLPPRSPAARPVTVELAGTLDEYRAALKAAGVPVLNAAVFLAADQRIVCGSDLTRLGDELHRTALHHSQQLATAERTEKQLLDLYKDKAHKPDLDRHLTTLKRERQRVADAEKANDAAFDAATRRLFATLYHEAFHSYTIGFVYPPLAADEVRAGKGTGELPRWLNEGLAVLFEDPVVEAGELRIGHADPDRLKRVQDWLAGKARGPDAVGLIPLADLLRAGREQFVTAHAGQKGAIDRTYLTAWAAAYYLTFERRVVGTKALDDYLVAVNTGGEPAKAFAALVGQDLPAFERDWHEFLKRLQPDGSVKR
jgi:hypothetical protein